jgi:hypothetical protein
MAPASNKANQVQPVNYLCDEGKIPAKNGA